MSRAWVMVVVLAVASAGCGSDRGPIGPDRNPGTAPSGPQPSPGPHVVTGSLVNALDDGAAPPASFTVHGTLVGLSDAGGIFSVGFPATGMNRTVITTTGFVTRETGVAAPGSGLRLSLIPSTFDLASFDQMFRHQQLTGAGPGLTRWTTPPGLVVERRVLQFTNVNAAAYEALEETLNGQETDEVIADMRAGYDLLTAGRIGPLASVMTQEAAAGATVSARQDGRIVVTRQAGLTKETGFWGYARWSTTAEGEVTSAVIILDRDFERSASVFHRSLRMHELGHALGCQHVSTGRLSVMNANARTEPNEFDRQSARLAMLRPTGNRTPDLDPAAHTATSAARTPPPLTWHGAH